MDLGLALVDVECGAGDQPLAEGPGQRLLVDDGAARGVDQIADRFMRANALRLMRCRVPGVAGT